MGRVYTVDTTQNGDPGDHMPYSQGIIGQSTTADIKAIFKGDVSNIDYSKM